ncbi:MAG: histidine phosphatase family protein [Gammaproteobacteria bacterium]|nr:histidine phosphatase family protein [Gammaproteobacteria bacterium]
MDVYLIRHPEADLDPQLCHGRLDPPARPGFEARAERIAAQLPRGAPVSTAASQRCRALADRLADRLGSTLRIDDRLRELDFGRWEGRPWHALPRAETQDWALDFWNHAPPDGEAYSAMHARVAAAWDDLLEHSGADAVIVASAGPLRALLTIALELPAESCLRIQIDHGGIARLGNSGGGWRLEFSNR